TCVITLFIYSFSFAQIIDSLLWIKAESGKTISIKGDLANGFVMKDLSWAWNSAVACFPQTQMKKFTGNHVLYATDLPSFSEMEVWVVPADENANFSLYAYEVGKIDKNNIVPNLSTCIRCEADHKWDYKKRGQTQDHTRRVKDIVAINNPYQVIIGVGGAEGLQKGAYTLNIKLNTR
ncbi:MAG: hypothetical protein SFU99_18490, partial [Saprospiraceae bacterium]|nr:hypothetical protein [Saprospiraceae bacterium]